MKIEDCLRSGNLQCARCLSWDSLSSQEKDILVDAIIANGQIDPETKNWIDDHALPERKKEN